MAHRAHFYLREPEIQSGSAPLRHHSFLEKVFGAGGRGSLISTSSRVKSFRWAVLGNDPPLPESHIPSCNTFHYITGIDSLAHTGPGNGAEEPGDGRRCDGPSASFGFDTAGIGGLLFWINWNTIDP